jgi:hypothetical protein
MTHTVRVLRVPPSPLLWRTVAAGLFTLGLILELWLLVMAFAVGTTALIRSRRWHRRTVLPAILAGTAAARSPGATPATAVEEWAACWLGVLSAPRPHWLREAAGVVAVTEQDPWAAHVAIARLQAAEAALREGRVFGLPPLRGHVPPGWRVVLWSIVAVLLLNLAHTWGTWWLLPTIGALTGVVSSLTEFRKSRTAPHTLAAEALTLPAAWDDAETSPLELALLAGGDDYVLRRARRLVERAPWDIPHREAALRQLRAAEEMTSPAGGQPHLGLASGFPWWEPL